MVDSSRYSQRFAAGLLAVVACLAAMSCRDASTDMPAASAEPAEPSFAEQAAAVRDGESDQIRLDHHSVSDTDLAELDGLGDRLKVLNLSHTTITDQGLSKIAEMPQLELLRLESAKVTDDGLASLAKLKNLRHLHLIDVPLTEQGLEHLHALTSLESLYLDGTQATEAGMKSLVDALPNVHLHFDGGHHRDDSHGHDH